MLTTLCVQVPNGSSDCRRSTCDLTQANHSAFAFRDLIKLAFETFMYRKYRSLHETNAATDEEA